MESSILQLPADWGCTEDTEKTAENIQSKNPELVIAAWRPEL